MSLTVNLYYTGKNGSAREFVNEMILSGTVKKILAEEGNLRYEYFFSQSNPETVLLIDQWENQRALDIHHKSPMMKTIEELRKKYKLHLKVERFTEETKEECKKKRLLEKFTLQQVKIENLNILVDFYNDVIDRTPNIQNTCKWKKNIYPAQLRIKEFILSNSLFAIFEDEENTKKVIGALAMIQEQEKEYDDVMWNVETKKDEVLIVHALAVNPDFQGQGFANYLIEKAINFARENNKKVVRLDSLESNKGAQKLYLAKGFKFCGEKELYTENTGLAKFYFYEYKL